MSRTVWALSAASILLSLRCLAAAALTWTDGIGYRTSPVRPEGSGKVGFTLMDSSETSVRFTNELRGDALLTNAVAHNGSGVAVGDVDGDGWADLYFCSLQGPNRLYRNLGNWRFEAMDIGDAACAEQFSTGATFADVDGDADLDLLVNGIVAGTRLFLNDGKGRWSEVRESGLSRTASATSMALADIDGDGDLDLYCTHYIDVMHLFDPTTRFAVIRRDGRYVVQKVNDQLATSPRWKDRFEALPDGKVRELPEVDGLYRNDGGGRFAAIQSEPGVFTDEDGKTIPPYRDWGLAAMFRDLNGDGHPDLYVCNDNASRADRIWINRGNGTFRAIEPLKLRHTSRASMGIDFADLDRDGHDDFIVLDMLARSHQKRMTQLVRDAADLQERERSEARPRFGRNTLFYGRSDGSFVEAALMAGVAASDWSWCPIFLDVDLDGYEDLLVTNGFEFDILDQDSQTELKSPQRRLTRDQLKRWNQFRPHARTPNVAFRNRGDGTFHEVSREWGFDFEGVSYGMALGDLDNDGDCDIVVNNLNAPASLYRNEGTAGRVAVRLKGLSPNTQGIGARLSLMGDDMTQSQEMICGGRYLSGDQSLRVFAVRGSRSADMQLEVIWRNGDRSVVTNVQPNCIYEVDQRLATRRLTIPTKVVDPPFFTNISAQLGHEHVASTLSDWERQPLLPRRLSRSSPGVAWHDVDGDGWDDLIVSATHGAPLTIFANQHGQSFRRLEGLPTSGGDQGSVLGWQDGQGHRKLLTAVSSLGATPDSASHVAVFTLTNGATPQDLPVEKSNLGPMTMADIDSDGDLDLFVGGRSQWGRYPEPVSSTLWLNEGGELRPSSVASAPFASLGLVNGAAFGDLNGDGQPDLAVAVEWDTIRVFRNQSGRFKDMTAAWGLANRKGWWNSVTLGDFDSDGRLDLAVGNWGRNSPYEIYRNPSTEQDEMPNPALRLYYGDWTPGGPLELMEAWKRGNDWLPVRNQLVLAAGLPSLVSAFPTHQAFAKATVSEILGARLATTQFVEATELRSGVFFNRDGRFEWAPLPREAQLAPVFSLNVGDMDGDGNEDLFLSQNFFGMHSDLSREDAGRGLWLRGNGQGALSATDSQLTGITVYGEQRGAALADFDYDGRVDLVVSQHGGATQLYKNQRARRGLRVTLRGPPGNPDGIGAVLRVLDAAGRAGPSRLVQAGSGYGSQDAAAQVLGLPASPKALWIRWPGGREQTIALSDQIWNLEVKFENETHRE